MKGRAPKPIKKLVREERAAASAYKAGGKTKKETKVDGEAAKERLDKRSRGGKLTTKARNTLPSEDFAFPKERKYPLNDKNHARNALARVSQFGSPEEKAKVRAKVHRKYPSIGE